MSANKTVIITTLSLVILLGVTLLAFWFGQSRSPKPTVSGVSTRAPATFLRVLHGKVSLEREKRVSTLSKDAVVELRPADIIITKFEAIAIVDYGHGTIVRLAPDSRITFTRTQGRQLSTHEYIGSLYVRFMHIIGFHEQFDVDSQNAIAGVNGTAFIAWVDQNSSNIYVTESTAHMSLKDTSGKPLPASTKDIGRYHQGSVSNDTSLPAEARVHVEQEPLPAYEQEWLDFNQAMDDVRAYNSHMDYIRYTQDDWLRIETLIADFLNKTKSTQITPTFALTPTPTPTLRAGQSVAPSSTPTPRPPSQPSNSQPTATPTTAPAQPTAMPTSTSAPTPTTPQKVVPSDTPTPVGGGLNNQILRQGVLNQSVFNQLILPSPTSTIILR